MWLAGSSDGSDGNGGGVSATDAQDAALVRHSYQPGRSRNLSRQSRSVHQSRPQSQNRELGTKPEAELQAQIENHDSARRMQWSLALLRAVLAAAVLWSAVVVLTQG